MYVGDGRTFIACEAGGFIYTLTSATTISCQHRKAASFRLDTTSGFSDVCSHAWSVNLQISCIVFSDSVKFLAFLYLGFRLTSPIQRMIWVPWLPHWRYWTQLVTVTRCDGPPGSGMLRRVSSTRQCCLQLVLCRAMHTALLPLAGRWTVWTQLLMSLRRPYQHCNQTEHQRICSPIEHEFPPLMVSTLAECNITMTLP